ncbi:MAG: FHA domain-containing protein [Actinomycetes bacterium]
MRCSRCGHDNSADARFCSSCGTHLVATEESTLSIPAVVANPVGSATGDGGALLHVARGPNAGSTYAIGARPLSVGRHPESDVFLDDITVSRRHAVFEARADGVHVRDAGSLNGTYVNRDRIEERALADGDEIQIGRYVLVLRTAR